VRLPSHCWTTATLLSCQQTAPGTPLPLTARLSSQPIYGVLGLINLSLCASSLISVSSPELISYIAEYVVVVTGRELQGRLMGHDVFRPTEFDFLPLNHRVSASNPSHPVEAHLLALLRSHLQGGFFLFSYTYDLTRRMQAQWDTRASDADKTYWEVVCAFSIWHMLTYMLKSCLFRLMIDSFGISEFPNMYAQNSCSNQFCAKIPSNAPHGVCLTAGCKFTRLYLLLC